MKNCCSNKTISECLCNIWNQEWDLLHNLPNFDCYNYGYWQILEASGVCVCEGMKLQVYFNIGFICRFQWAASFFELHGLALQIHKELYQITKTSSLENLQQLKWIAQITMRKWHNQNVDILNCFKQNVRKGNPVNIGKSTIFFKVCFTK